MFNNQQKKIKRSAKLVQVISKYGLQDILERMMPGTSSEDAVNKAAFVRLRLALEELGPSFVKLGQSFSNRDDLLPKALIEELQKLQDRVEVVDIDVQQILEKSLDIKVEEHFNTINYHPIAAASIAQVYKAQLKNGQEVILKIRRPGIDQVIQADILLLKDLVNIVDTYSEFGEQLNLRNALFAFEASLLEELSLNNEKNNLLKFQSNYANTPQTHVPSVFEEYCTNQILTMEYIEGIKITDVEQLKHNNFDIKKLSEWGYRLFVSQILEYGFFHADPHAGNILVNNAGQIVFIDFGAVGVIPEGDRKILEQLILNFMGRKADKIIRNLKKIALDYQIPNDRKFENDVQQILEIIHNSSLKDINIPDIMNKMKTVLTENRLIMPDYFYLLFKGISLIDGVGRRINPDLDVVESLKPFTQKIILNKIKPQQLMQKSMDKLSDLSEHFEEIPKEVRSVLYKLDEGELSVNMELKNLTNLEYLIKTSITNLILALVISANVVAMVILWVGRVGPEIAGVPLISGLGLLLSATLTLFLVGRLLRR